MDYSTKNLFDPPVSDIGLRVPFLRLRHGSLPNHERSIFRNVLNELITKVRAKTG